MKALLKNGEWVEIETAHLFHDQYNTVDKRIYDADIVRIVDDARVGMGKCRYCGALVKRGEEHKHFEEQESKSCEGCFWYRDELIGEPSKDTLVETTTDANGITTTKKTITTVSQYEKVCTYKKEGHIGDCMYKECREYGINWFTPDNTFFLKHPNGFNPVMATVDDLENRGFIVSKNNVIYKKNIGSYTLRAFVNSSNDGVYEIKSYFISNCRRHYSFKFENGELFTHDSRLGWKQVRTLGGVPDSVMKEVRKICC